MVTHRRGRNLLTVKINDLGDDGSTQVALLGVLRGGGDERLSQYIQQRCTYEVFSRATRTSSRRNSGRCCSRPSCPPRRCCTSRTIAPLRGSATLKRRRSAWFAPRTPRAFPARACADA